MVYILEIPKKDIIFLNKTMPQKKITTELARFHIDPTKELQNQGSTARYIVATSSAFSVGITLSEALTVGFLEPDFRPATMLQGFARHTRQGNQNPVTYSYLCEVVGNRVEERIVEVSKLRASIDAATGRKTASTGAEPTEAAVVYID
jgi:SNF2 family DNA or RNA helicase